MKKVFYFLVIAILLIFLTSCNNTDKYIKNYGRIYTVQNAYNEGLLTYDELLTLAYYQNNGRIGNEDLMKETFTPIPILPDKLDETIIHKIKASNAKTKEEYDSYEVFDYFGTYSGAVAIKLKSTLYNIPAVIREEQVEDVLFIYPTYSILVWKENI